MPELKPHAFGYMPSLNQFSIILASSKTKIPLSKKQKKNSLSFLISYKVSIFIDTVYLGLNPFHEYHHEMEEEVVNRLSKFRLRMRRKKRFYWTTRMSKYTRKSVKKVF